GNASRSVSDAAPLSPLALARPPQPPLPGREADSDRAAEPAQPPKAEPPQQPSPTQSPTPTPTPSKKDARTSSSGAPTTTAVTPICDINCGGTTPWANAGGPYSAQPNQAIQFDSSGSGDDGFITAYSWNFGDGTTSTLASPAKAYAAAGTYNVSLRVRDNSGLWSDYAYTTATISNPAPVNDAAFVSQAIPTEMNAGQQYSVSVTMYNSGTKTWTAAELYRLGSQNPQDNVTWGGSRINLPASVAPGQSVTFNFNVTAPSTPGTYNLQARMVQDGVQWFGATTPNVAVTVTQAAVGSCAGPTPCDGHPTITYDPLTNRINAAGWLYDAAGNQIRARRADGTWQRFVYDAAGRLTRVKDDAGNTTLIYRYGADNRRLVTQEGGDTSNVRTYHVWDADSVIAEFGETAVAPSAPAWRKNYIYMEGRLLATQEPAGGGVESVLFHHPDHQSTRLVTSQATGSSFEQTNLPFGNAMSAESTGATTRRFTSYDRSAVSGLDYAINRHYDPLQGRFTQVDPIGVKAWNLSDPQTLNLYAYCGNDPVNNVDPDGLFFGKLFKGIGKLFKGVGQAVVKAAKAVGKFISSTAAILAKVLHSRWFMLCVAMGSFFFPPAFAIYKTLTEVSNIIQVSLLLIQGRWKELAATLVQAAIQWAINKAVTWGLEKAQNWVSEHLKLGIKLTSLPACAKKALRALYPHLNLDKIKIYTGLPWLWDWFGFHAAGFTYGHNQYYKAGVFDDGSAASLKLFAHETKHSDQFRQFGTYVYDLKYLGQIAQHGYENSPFEVAGRSGSNQMGLYLNRHGDPCD
ncbi:MAG TPA: PKD domain-containing protein, partial [Pyrinomonadaceae bacterium]|nr:PKD domain-containing protein [Pyrinomonadaceae bacterium]